MKIIFEKNTLSDTFITLVIARFSIHIQKGDLFYGITKKTDDTQIGDKNKQ